MIYVPVSIAANYTAGFSTHKLLMPPAVVTPAPVPSCELPCTELWPPGVAMNAHKLTTTVKHRQMTIAQNGHDCGPFILDVTVPATNSWYPVMYPFSSRKVAFGASAVKMNGGAVGCVHPLMPKMTCGEPVSAPTAFPVTSPFNTVLVRVTLGDFLGGLAKIALSIAIALTFDKVFEKLRRVISGKPALAAPAQPVLPQLKESLRRMGVRVRASVEARLRERVFSAEVLEGFSKDAREAVSAELAKKLKVSVSAKGVTKSLLAGFSGFGVDSVRRLSGNEDVDPSLKVSAGGKLASVEASANPWSGKAKVQVKAASQGLAAQRVPATGDQSGEWKAKGALFGKQY